MKYGILFSIVAILLVASAFLHRGWHFALLWPAVSFAVVASGYLGLGPRVFGKAQQGVLLMANSLLLLPYLLYLWAVWYTLRIFRRESSFDQLTDKIYIGRRLMGREFAVWKHREIDIEHVIDLTCEFTEPKPMRSLDYHSFPILDGFVPQPDQLQSWVRGAAKLQGNIYIHCAEGHGRTGLFAAALLVELDEFESGVEALEFVKSKRPRVRLGKRQISLLS